MHIFILLISAAAAAQEPKIQQPYPDLLQEPIRERSEQLPQAPLNDTAAANLTAPLNETAAANLTAPSTAPMNATDPLLGGVASLPSPARPPRSPSVITSGADLRVCRCGQVYKPGVCPYAPPHTSMFVFDRFVWTAVQCVNYTVWSNKEAGGHSES